MIQALELTARLGIHDPDGAWRSWGFGEEGRAISPAEWETLGLPSSLMLEGRFLSADVFAAGDGIDWGMEPEPGDFLAGDAEGLPLFNEIPAELRARGSRLAERVAAEAATLWVVDPQGQWHLGQGAPEWSEPLPQSMDQWIQLDRPDSWEHDWPWKYVPEHADPDQRWSVGLPREWGWDDSIRDATDHYCRAMTSASNPVEVERALGLGLIALRAMNAAIGWMADEFRVRDFTGRSPTTDASTVTWPKDRARALRERLRTFAEDVPEPPRPTSGVWSIVPGSS